MSDLSVISENIKVVRDKIKIATVNRNKITFCSEDLADLQRQLPRLVCVSKTKPVECIIQAYNDGERHFGENYVQELVEKAVDPRIKSECPDIKWHFIGHLQKNKISKIASIPLYMIETVDSQSLAKNLNDSLERKEAKELLNVMIQVNTSGEEAKSGVEPSDTTSLAKYIIDDCPKLKFIGLMTIGAIESSAAEVNQDFKTLFNLRQEVCQNLNLKLQDVELSMGMSSDFEEAIQMGSTNLRVGSTIFGARQQKPV